MTGEVVVDPWVLTDASTAWREQSAQVTTASTRISSASTAGFGPAVSSAARSFTTAWGTITSDLGTAADDVSDHLDEGAAAYLQTDVRAQDSFDTWLASKAP